MDKVQSGSGLRGHADKTEPLFVLRGHFAAVHSVNFTPALCDAPALLSSDEVGVVKVWNLDTARPVVSWKAQSEAVLEANALEHANEPSVFTQAKSGVLTVWSMGSSVPKPLHSITAGPSFCKAAQDETSLYVAGDDQSVVRWDQRSVTLPTLAPKGNDGMPMALCAPNECDAVLVGWESGAVEAWSKRIGKCIARVQPSKQAVTSVSAIASGEGCWKGVFAGADTALRSWHLNWNKVTLKIKRTTNLPNPGVSQVAVREDGRVTATAGWDGVVRLYSTATLKPLAALRHHTSSVLGLALANRPYLGVGASCSKDKTIAIWQLYSPKGIAQQEEKATQ